MKMARSGFSLVELLCVVAIVGLLMFFMTSHGDSPEKRARVACQRNLEKISLALSIYANDSQGAFPVATNAVSSEAVLSLLVPRSTAMTEIFICPGSGDKPLAEGEPFTNSRISYAYYMGLKSANDPGAVLVTDWQVDTNAKLQGQRLFSLDGSPPGNNHGKSGGSLMQADGRMEFSPAKAVRDLPLASGLQLLNPK